MTDSVYPTKICHINEFLKFKFLSRNGIFIKGDWRMNDEDKFIKLRDFKSSFEILCDNIYELMIENRIAIDISIILFSVDRIDTYMVMSQIIDETFFYDDYTYQTPEKNPYCQALITPHVFASYDTPTHRTGYVCFQNAQMLDKFNFDT